MPNITSGKPEGELPTIRPQRGCRGWGPIERATPPRPSDSGPTAPLAGCLEWRGAVFTTRQVLGNVFHKQRPAALPPPA